MSSELKSLGNLSPARGSNKKKKRLGRGAGGGLGKTAGKGHKGQRARKGGKVAAGFEGGQTPLYRRLPKRGFKSLNKKEYCEVNLESLNRFDEGTRITAELLASKGLVKNSSSSVKLLGRGKLEKPLVIRLHKLSNSARLSVLQVGGAIEEM